ncbi:hypothetical protein GU927_006215 [Rhodobacteraceae bacterium HSP-20]|uniref:Pilus assembly protein n=1 Tax=Paragemmobacter amnigenus TaxID=2852097 RepID=A0ABS6J127_9RHOB|nr:hypothetical protein [Rhodobacter amnigenus]MBU9697438.1 hypothetical protein [Rhodobacter amnigenus]MBV4388665.1 hypothetical protein [Rhodobacter amnigenus]
MAFLTILAIGTFGLLLAGVSHISISRERKALLDARARLAEEQAAKAATETEASSVRHRALSAFVLRASLPRHAQAAPKQYRRVRAKL